MKLKEFEKTLNKTYGKKLGLQIFNLMKNPGSPLVVDWCTRFLKTATKKLLVSLIIDVAKFLIQFLQTERRNKKVTDNLVDTLGILNTMLSKAA